MSLEFKKLEVIFNGIFIEESEKKIVRTKYPTTYRGPKTWKNIKGFRCWVCSCLIDKIPRIIPKEVYDDEIEFDHLICSDNCFHVFISDHPNKKMIIHKYKEFCKRQFGKYEFNNLGDLYKKSDLDYYGGSLTEKQFKNKVNNL